MKKLVFSFGFMFFALGCAHTDLSGSRQIASAANDAMQVRGAILGVQPVFMLNPPKVTNTRIADDYSFVSFELSGNMMGQLCGGQETMAEVKVAESGITQQMDDASEKYNLIFRSVASALTSLNIGDQPCMVSMEPKPFTVSFTNYNYLPILKGKQRIWIYQVFGMQTIYSIEVKLEKDKGWSVQMTTKPE